ncbi:DNA polymerase III subunit beta [Rhizobium sp. Leaf383]|uniref:DNA polymerase III subunit beta n=1 Tax=Rhizobium sp. Leaf383 TaxID=1736357 RepID=UPI0007124FDB|nr:DNA polymerase III subunit beta [Rhizobium sp. Leaf383]KQS86966.1 hypothetical protein ASG58_01600 [Rhizobium sp. Leaf383]
MNTQNEPINFVTVEAKALRSALKPATLIVEPRNTIPVLSMVRLSYSAKGLAIVATDLDLELRIEVDEIEGAGEWSICIVAKELANIAAAAGVSPVMISLVAKETETTHYAVRITAGDCEYSLAGCDPADFPLLQGERMQRIERFTNGQLAVMLEKVACCISKEETRYYLNGVNWTANSEGKHFAATDGHRLARCRYDKTEATTAFSYIIPRKTIEVLVEFFTGADVEILSVGKGNEINHLLLDVHAPGLSMRTKLIDGNFPDIARVIPVNQDHWIAIKREEMLSAIRQATAISGLHRSAIRLHDVGGRLAIETKNLDSGTAKVTTSSQWPTDLQAIGVNSRYMAEMLKQCQGDIKLGTSSPGAPFTLSDDDKDMTRVVMPMRI